MVLAGLTSVVILFRALNMDTPSFDLFLIEVVLIIMLLLLIQIVILIRIFENTKR